MSAIVLFEKFIVFFKLESSPNKGHIWKRKPLLKEWLEWRVFI